MHGFSSTKKLKELKEHRLRLQHPTFSQRLLLAWLGEFGGHEASMRFGYGGFTARVNIVTLQRFIHLGDILEPFASGSTCTVLTLPEVFAVVLDSGY